MSLAQETHAGLADKYRKFDIEEGTIHFAALQGDLEAIEEFIARGIAKGTPPGITLNSRESSMGVMPVHLACDSGQPEVVQYLIAKRIVDLDAGDFLGVTALHVACIEDAYEIVRLLLVARAAADRADAQGDMPIHWAATTGHPDVIELLINFNSPIDPRNKAGWTPLHRAAYNGRANAALVLAHLGAKLNAKNNDGNTPLHLACFMNHVGLVEMLLKVGARADSLNDRNQSCEELCISEAAADLILQYKRAQRHMKREQTLKLPPGASLQELQEIVAHTKPPVEDGFPDMHDASPTARKRRQSGEGLDSGAEDSFLDYCMPDQKQIAMMRASMGLLPGLSMLKKREDEAASAAAKSRAAGGSTSSCPARTSITESSPSARRNPGDTFRRSSLPGPQDIPTAPFSGRQDASLSPSYQRSISTPVRAPGVQPNGAAHLQAADSGSPCSPLGLPVAQRSSVRDLSGDVAGPASGEGRSRTLSEKAAARSPHRSPMQPSSILERVSDRTSASGSGGAPAATAVRGRMPRTSAPGYARSRLEVASQRGSDDGGGGSLDRSGLLPHATAGAGAGGSSGPWSQAGGQRTSRFSSPGDFNARRSVDASLGRLLPSASASPAPKARVSMAGAGSPTVSRQVPRTSASGSAAGDASEKGGVHLPRFPSPAPSPTGMQLAAGMAHKPVSLPGFGRPVGGLVYMMMQEQYKQQT